MVRTRKESESVQVGSQKKIMVALTGRCTTGTGAVIRAVRESQNRFKKWPLTVGQVCLGCAG